MFEAAIDGGRRIGVVATFSGTIPVAEPQIRAMAAVRGVDVICLAQFSMARARRAVEGHVSIPVLTSPTAAVQRLRSLLG